MYLPAVWYGSNVTPECPLILLSEIERFIESADLFFTPPGSACVRIQGPGLLSFSPAIRGSFPGRPQGRNMDD
jgi:hypothetical protein